MTREANPMPHDIARIVWAALLVSQWVYAGVVLFIGEPDVARSSETLLPIALGSVACALAAGAHFAWRSATGTHLPAHSGPPELPVALPRYIIAWMLIEAIALGGLVLGMLGFGASSWGPFMVAGTILMFLHQPRA